MVRRRIIRIGCMWMRISVLAAENVFRCVLWIIWNCGRERLSRGTLYDVLPVCKSLSGAGNYFAGKEAV